VLDAVVEGVDHPVERVAAAGPLVQRRLLGHERNVSGLL
jgi:hypothetical protein